MAPKITNSQPASFDVTCVIGTVVVEPFGINTPHEAAFLLIANHGAGGHFTFPDDNGNVIHVDVSYQPDAV